jgi:hypothetical protein
MVPEDLLSPIWRCEPNHGSGTFTIGLDPREAAVVLGRGWATLDGIRYRTNLEGCTGNVDGDGRVMIRCEIDDRAGAEMLWQEAEARRRHEYGVSVEEQAWVG